MKRLWTLVLVAAAAIALVAGITTSARNAGAAVAAQATRPSPRMFLSVKGQMQGVIRGEMHPGLGEYAPTTADQIAVYGFTGSVQMPRDAGTGLPTGKRKHGPLTVTIAWSKASPIIYAAAVHNENLPEVIVSFYEPTGKTTGYQRYGYIKLTNATIASIDEITPSPGVTLDPNPRDGASKHVRHLEKVSFVFERIEWTSVTGGTTAEDDWESPVMSAGTR
jgi:type VI secretion system secreted protein Hcp